MQSIYQFREAEVGLFLRARDYGIGEIGFEPLQLRRNFRSSAGLIAWVNEQFSLLFPADDDARRAAIRFLPSVPAAPPEAAVSGAGAAAAAVQLHRLPPGDLAAEAQCVVGIVRAARARNPAASIAVLVASREHVAPSVAQLRAAGFAVRGVDLERLGDRPAIRDLAAITRALVHAADRTAWLALLRAPWCGMSLAELEGLLNADDGDVYMQLQRAAQAPREPAHAGALALTQRLTRLCAALAPAIQGAERALPLWQRVEHCWLRLAAPAVYGNDVDRLDAQRFIDALALHDEPERLVGEALGELTERLYSGAPPQPGAIELMTMHAAKGLEWDVVILPGLGRRTALDRDPLLHWIELPRASSGTDLLLAPIRAGEQELRASVAGYIKCLRRERTRLERVRLLYVAATRARLALHLLAALPEPAGTAAAASAVAQPQPQRGSLLEILWPAVGGAFLARTQQGEGAPQAEGADPTLPSLWRLPANWSIPNPPARVRLARLALGSPASAAAPEYRWVGSTARAIGTIVHAELHRLSTGAELPASTAAATGPAGYDAWLAELGIESGQHAAASARVREALARTLSDARGRWLLSAAHVEARSEWRLTGLHEGRVVNVIIDRMLVDEHGQRWIIDFKTGTHEGGAARAFIDSEVERYRPQLQRYAALAARLGPEPVRLALYFPLLGIFREIDAALP
jgi:ATP-dependent exoDNAse (exonuclease V) beta subunit